MLHCGEFLRPCCASSLISGLSSPRAFLSPSPWRGPGLDATGLGDPAVRRGRAPCRQPARALGLRREHWSVLGRADCGGDILDLAMGADWLTAVDASDRLPRRARSSRAAARVSRCNARQRARALTRRDLLPTFAGE